MPAIVSGRYDGGNERFYQARPPATPPKASSYVVNQPGILAGQTDGASTADLTLAVAHALTGQSDGTALVVGPDDVSSGPATARRPSGRLSLVGGGDLVRDPTTVLTGSFTVTPSTGRSAGRYIYQPAVQRAANW